MRVNMDETARRRVHPFHTHIEKIAHQKPGKIKVNADYVYRLRGAAPWLHKALRRVVLVVFGPLFALWGWQVCGKEHLNGLPGGAVTVCNHVHPLDCVRLACALFSHEMYFLSLKANLELPVAGRLVRLLGGLPLPETAAAGVHLSRTIRTLLGQGALVQIYPEGVLVPYCSTLRPFARGAFCYAADSGAPVLPCVLVPRPRTGWRRFTGKKPLLQLVILPPVYPQQGPRRAAATKLQQQVTAAMQAVLLPVEEQQRYRAAGV